MQQATTPDRMSVSLDFLRRMAVTSELTTGNLAPTAPIFAAMSVKRVRCPASDATACAPRVRRHACRETQPSHRLRLPNHVVELRGRAV